MNMKSGGKMTNVPFIKNLLVFVIFILLIPGIANTSFQKGGAYYDLGVFAFEDKKYDEAQKYLKIALTHMPNDPFCHFYIGRTYLESGKLSLARKHLYLAKELNPHIYGLTYELAYLTFKEKKYARAFQLFEQNIKKNPKHVLSRYHAAICLFHLKKYPKALLYFKKSSEQSPYIRNNCQYYMAICYTQSGNTDRSLEILNHLKNQLKSGQLKDDVLKWIQLIEKLKKKQKPFQLLVKTEYQYNDNVLLQSPDMEMEDQDTDQKDSIVSAYFSANYTFFKDKPLHFETGYRHYQSFHQDLTEYNMVASTLVFNMGYQFEPIVFNLGYIPAHYWVDTELFIRRHRFKPELIWTVNEHMHYALSAYYEKQTWLQNHEKDGHLISMANDFYYKWKNTFIVAGLSAEENHASKQDQSFEQLKLNAGISVMLPWKVKCHLSGFYVSKRYQGIDTVYGIKRKDTKKFSGLTFAKTLLDKGDLLKMGYNYTENNSTINDLDYQKHITLLSYEIRY